MSQDLIERFCHVTGADSDTASSFLNMCNANLDIAVSMFMDDPSAANQSLPVNSETEYRIPIPQRTEQLLPVEVTLIPSHFARPVAPLRATRRRAFVADDSDDDVQVVAVSVATGQNGIVVNNMDSSNAFPTSSNGDQLAHENPANASSHPVSSGSQTVVARKRGHLHQLYRPPTEIIFNGTLLEAHTVAGIRRQWLLVSVHDEGCFDCHILNRDVWKDPHVYQTIKRNFTFIQIPVDSQEGFRYRSRHSYVIGASHIAILNPFTGDQMMFWTHLKDPEAINEVLTEFLDHCTLHDPTSEALAHIMSDATFTYSSSGSTTTQVNSGCSTSSSSAVSSSSTRKRNPAENGGFETYRYPFKQSRLEGIDLTNKVAAVSSQITDSTSPFDMSEEEQLRLAIEASKNFATTHSNGDPAETATPIVDTICLTDDDEGDARSSYSDVDDECYILDPNIIQSDPLVCSSSSSEFAKQTNVPLPLPVPTDENAIALVVRLPTGDRELISVPSDMKIQILLDYFDSRGFSSSRYEIIRLYPHLSLSTLPKDTLLLDAGFAKKDTVYIQDI